MDCKECNNRRCLRSSAQDKCNTCVYRNSYYLDVNDWLSDIKLPQGSPQFDCVEVRFKNGRKGFYRNVNNLPLQQGDVVAVESSPGHDIGNISLCGELTRVQMLKKGEDPANPELKKIYRHATAKDIEVWKNAISREKSTLVRTREICDSLGLSMKLSDVEYQGDNLKATFYYTAEGRIDFRQLIKELASAFSIRVEMRQIGLRQEAARVGGIGSCGRELCCTTWLTDFRSVNTTAARYQRLSLNPQKLAGQCGKLKCCLNFELDTYVDALKDFPNSDIALVTEKGTAHFQKMDVFKGMYWYAYDFEFMNWIGLSVNAVRHIQSLNRRGEKVESLEMYIEEIPEKPHKKATSIEMKSIEEDSLTRFDKKKNKSQKKNSSQNERQNNSSSEAKPSAEKESSRRREKQGKAPKPAPEPPVAPAPQTEEKPQAKEANGEEKRKGNKNPRRRFKHNRQRGDKSQESRPKNDE